MKKPFSILERIKSFGPAFKGLKLLFVHEHNAWVHLLATVVVISLGIGFNINISEWIALSIVIGLVFLSELFNTAIERLADKVEPNWDQLIGEVKDYASAAVLIASILAVIVGGIIFLPKTM